MRALVVTIGFILTLGHAGTATQPAALMDREAYAVYGSALINVRRELPEIALLAETRADGQCDTHVPNGWEDVAADLVRQNGQSRMLLGGFDLGRPYRMVSAADLAAASRASRDRVENGDLSGRSPFEQYREAEVFILSAVGFNADRTRAMFMLQQTCGVQCWQGEQILRVRVAGQWLDLTDVPGRCVWIT
jgi:hypothetical protein